MDEQMKRWMLFMLVAFPVILLFQIKQQDKIKKAREAQELIESQQSPEQTEPLLGDDGTTRSVTTRPSGTQHPEPLPAEKPSKKLVGELITVETDTYKVTFTTAGAYPKSWQIIDRTFAKVVQSDIDDDIKNNRKIRKMGDFLPIEIIPQYEGISQDREYPLMTVLKDSTGAFLNLNDLLYKVDGPKTVSVGSDGAQEVLLTFTSEPTPEGIRMVKTFHFPASGYLTRLEIRVENVSSGRTFNFTESVRPGMGLMWGPGVGKSHFKDRWDGAVYKAVVNNGEEILSERFSKWADSRPGNIIEKTWGEIDGRDWNWAMLDSRFYSVAIIPSEPSPLVRGIIKISHVPKDPKLRVKMAVPSSIELHSAGFSLAPGASHDLKYSLFVGPKQRSLMAKIDKENGYNLRRVLFQSNWWLSDNLIRPLAVFMLYLLGLFHDLSGSYGIAIILVVLVMRLLTQPFTHMGMKSQARVMAEQKRIKPLIDAINEKFKDDPQKKSAETWKTYREHGVNPLGMLKGCGWMLVQMPIFFALYRLLMGAVDLRGEGFLWIADLTAPDALFTLPFSLPFLGDKFNILPILMGLSQLTAQRLQTTNMQDPMQKQMATMMPIMFIFMLYNFAAGLSLYWFISNIWQIVFQIFINKKIKEEAEQKAIKAFDARQKAVADGTFQKKKKNPGKPSWRDRMMATLEEKAKEAEEKKKQTQAPQTQLGPERKKKKKKR